MNIYLLLGMIPFATMLFPVHEYYNRLWDKDRSKLEYGRKMAKRIRKVQVFLIGLQITFAAIGVIHAIGFLSKL